MVRAGGVPRDRALGAISSIIGARTETVTITRPTESVGSMGEVSETTATHTEDLWLNAQQIGVIETPAGERETGAIFAVGLDGIDVQKDDRVTHGGVEYEVDSVVGIPDDNDADGTTHSDTRYFRIRLVRRAA